MSQLQLINTWEIKDAIPVLVLDRAACGQGRRLVEAFLAQPGALALVASAKDRFRRGPPEDAALAIAELAVIVSSAAHPHHTSPASAPELPAADPDQASELATVFAEVVRARPDLAAAFPSGRGSVTRVGRVVFDPAGLGTRLHGRIFGSDGTAAERAEWIAQLRVVRLAERMGANTSLWEARDLPLFQTPESLTWWAGLGAFGLERPSLTADEWRSLARAGVLPCDRPDLLSQHLATLDPNDAGAVEAAIVVLDDPDGPPLGWHDERVLARVEGWLDGPHARVGWYILPRIHRQRHVRVTRERALRAIALEDTVARRRAWWSITAAGLASDPVVRDAVAAADRRVPFPDAVEWYTARGGRRELLVATLSPGVDATFGPLRFFDEYRDGLDRELVTPALAEILIELLERLARDDPRACAEGMNVLGTTSLVLELGPAAERAGALLSRLTTHAHEALARRAREALESIDEARAS